jgi:prepilin-type N-terminal cleavage/methylation domain-containing protein
MRRRPAQAGFSLLELVVAMAILLVISVPIFGLLGAAQARYRSEQQLLDSLQSTRVGLDQLVREIHNAGFPGANTYTAVPATPTAAPNDLQRKFAIPFRGYTGTYPSYAYSQTCVINSTCTNPDGNHVSMEMDLDPYNASCSNQVEIVDYDLVADGSGTTSTLMRRVTSKPGNAGGYTNCLPVWPAWSGGAWVPFVENVINAYQSPTVPVFTYVCEDGTTSCVPEKIQTVSIKLLVQTVAPDLQTHRVQTVTLQTVVNRLNPNQ